MESSEPNVATEVDDGLACTRPKVLKDDVPDMTVALIRRLDGEESAAALRCPAARKDLARSNSSDNESSSSTANCPKTSEGLTRKSAGASLIEVPGATRLAFRTNRAAKVNHAIVAKSVLAVPEFGFQLPILCGHADRRWEGQNLLPIIQRARTLS